MSSLPGQAREKLSRLKYRATRSLSPKAYWYLMGRIKPVAAVTSECASVTDSLASGAAVVALLDQLGVINPAAVTLHIGSGIGRVEYHLQARVRRCHGVDISPSMVRKARKLVPFENVEFHCTEGKGLDQWDDGTFDLVYSFLVFQHLPRPQFRHYVNDAYGKLAPRGHLVFQMMIDETGANPDPPPSHPYGLRYYSRADVEVTLKAAGFLQVRRVMLNGDPDDGSIAVGDVVFHAAKA